MNHLLSALSAACASFDLLQAGDAFQVVYEIRGVQRCSVALDRTEAIETAARDVIGRLELGSSDERAAAERVRGEISTDSATPEDDGAGSEDSEER